MQPGGSNAMKKLNINIKNHISWIYILIQTVPDFRDNVLAYSV